MPASAFAICYQYINGKLNFALDNDAVQGPAVHCAFFHAKDLNCPVFGCWNHLPSLVHIGSMVGIIQATNIGWT